jgi:hypothetical protein
VIKSKPGESVKSMKERMRAKLKAEGVLQIDGDALPDAPPATDEDIPRLVKRTRIDARDNAFSPSRGWSEYERGRVDDRHDRTRELSYDELVGFITSLPPIVALLAESHSAERDVTPAVRALQLALAELIDAEDEEAAAEAEAEQQLEAEHEEEERPIAALSLRTPAPMAGTSAGGSAVVQPRVAAGQRLRLALKQIVSLEEAGNLGQLMAPGARGAALYLVQHKTTPSKAKIDGGGYWQADSILYGYYDTSLFTATAVPDALPFAGSSKVHMSAGMCDDLEQAQREGPLTWLDVVCPCAPCCCLEFARCEMKGAFGSVKVASVKRATTTGLPSQSASLEEFSKMLDKDKIVAVRVADDEATIEGAVWLALINGKAETLAKDELHAGQLFQKGWTVVHGHWFSFKRVHPAGSSNRVYFALEEETLFNVQSMIRLHDIRFQQALPRRSRVTSPEWYKNEFTLSDDVYQKLINSL